MSWAEKGNPYKRSWGSPPPDMTGIIRMISDGAKNSVTTYKERQERSQKFYDALVKAIEDEENWKLTHPSFSDEQIKKLNSRAFGVYRLNGVTLKSILDKKGIVRTWNEGAEFENDVSMECEVAACPFILHDGYKTWAEQVKVFNKFRKKIREEIPGVDALIGRVVDYADLELSHKSKRFGRSILNYYQNGGVRTITPYPSNENLIATIVSPQTLNDTYRIDIGPSTGEEKASNIGILPLIIPTGIHYKGKGK